MQYRLLLWFTLVIGSCQQPELVDSHLFDHKKLETFLTIDKNLQSVTLSINFEGIPKKYPLQLHAITNSERPLTKDGDDFAPLVFEQVIFSYQQDLLAGQQAPLTATCVMREVAIGAPQKLEASNCSTGTVMQQFARACAGDEDSYFAVAASNKDFICTFSDDSETGIPSYCFAADNACLPDSADNNWLDSYLGKSGNSMATLFALLKEKVKSCTDSGGEVINDKRSFFCRCQEDTDSDLACEDGNFLKQL